MKNVIKTLYYLIPFKLVLFRIIKPFFKPNLQTAGYLKFKGCFNLSLPNKDKIKIYNHNLTIPTLLFWHGLIGYEPLATHIWSKLSKKSHVIFDLGSNFGLYSLIASKMQPDAEIFAFEPLQRNYDLIEKNKRINNFNIRIEKLAVSDTVGTATFYDMDSFDNTIASFNPDFIKAHQHHKKLIPMNVETVSLDYYCKKNNINKIDLIKIDVEGHESEVIQGAKTIISLSKPTMLIEISSESNFNEILKFISSIPGYNLYALDEENNSIIHSPCYENKIRNYIFSVKEII